MDVHLGERFTAEARKVVLFHDHADADRLFDDVLSRTLFSFQTNRRIFRGMVAFQDDARWHRVFAEILRAPAMTSRTRSGTGTSASRTST
jgi:hypothetical protein